MRRDRHHVRMTDDLYERYKEALRNGHVAVLRGLLDDALEAYRVAADIAPARALPHTSLGGVFMRLDRVEEALIEFAAAVARAPHDEGALLGQAEALVAVARRAEAASALDRVAQIQEAAGRLPEAADTLRRALELDDSLERVRRQRSLLRQIRLSAGDHAAEQQLAKALRLREEPAAPAAVDAPTSLATRAVEPAGPSPVAEPESAAAVVPEPAAVQAEPTVEAKQGIEPEPESLEVRSDEASQDEIELAQLAEMRLRALAVDDTAVLGVLPSDESLGADAVVDEPVMLEPVAEAASEPAEPEPVAEATPEPAAEPAEPIAEATPAAEPVEAAQPAAATKRPLLNIEELIAALPESALFTDEQLARHAARARRDVEQPIAAVPDTGPEAEEVAPGEPVAAITAPPEPPAVPDDSELAATVAADDEPAAIGVMASPEELAPPARIVALGREPAPPSPGDELLLAAEAAEAAEDSARLRTLLLEAARAYGREGRFDAGLDAAHRLLLRGPADVDAHLVLVELYVSRSWDALAAEKLILLGRLADLDGDEATRQRLCAAASQAFPADTRLQALCS